MLVTIYCLTERKKAFRKPIYQTSNNRIAINGKTKWNNESTEAQNYQNINDIPQVGIAKRSVPM